MAQMPVSEPFSKNGRSFAKTIFWGKDFAKLRLIFLKFGGVLNSDSRAEDGSGEESARVSAFLFWRANIRKNFYKLEFCVKIFLFRNFLIIMKKIAIVGSEGGMSCAYFVGVVLALVEKFNLTDPHIVIGSSGSTGTLAYYVSG
ncbi:MAG: hypothetical protein NT091_03250 [Candidatus Falkowbacteria bacterium]|nr:hypothetical protein [Candidatus Falkowbacteria bacterium]